MLQLISTLLSIKPNEWKSVLYFFLITLTFSFGASIARSIGMTLVVQHLGGENLPQIFMLIDLCAMFGFIAYAKYTKRVSGLDILGFFLLSVAIFSVLGMALFMLEYRWVYGFFMVGFYFFYILISIHVGSVVASYFTSVQLKRVTGFINTGMPIGGALGGGVLILLLQFIPPQWLVLMLGLAALAAFGLVRLVHAKLSPVRAGHALSKSGKPLLQEFSGAFSYIIHSRLMLYMSLGLILFVLCNKLLEYQYQALIYPKEFPDATQRATFFATYELVANLLWLSIQLFFTSRIIVRLGVGASNLLHPIMATLVSIGLILHFGFYAGFLAQFVNQEMRGALRTPANNLLFNAIPPNMWGITKAFLNGIVFPLSTFAASTSLLLMRNYMDDDQLMFLLPLLSLFLAVIGIAVALPQWAAYNEGVFGQLKRFVPSTDGIGKGMGNVIEDKLNSAVPQDVSAALGMIRVLHLTEYVHLVGKLLRSSNNLSIKRECLKTLVSLPMKEVVATHLVNALRAERNPQTLVLLLKNLGQLQLADAGVLDTVEKFLQHPAPAVFVEACLCLYNNPAYPRKAEIEQLILRRLDKPDLPQFSLYLYAIGELRQPRHGERVEPFLEHPQQDVRLAAFTAHIQLREGQLDAYKDRFIKELDSPSKEMKILALRALKDCSPPSDWTPVIHLLGAKDRAIINEAKELLRLTLSANKNALIAQAFNPNVAVEEKFEILSLIYPKLNSEQGKQLQQAGDQSLREFIYTMGLARLYQKHAGSPSGADELAIKILLEIAENHLLTVLTVITYMANESLEFFQQVSRGLQSTNRAHQGNTLEVLSNLSEKYLSSRLLKYFEERQDDIQSIARLHDTLFDAPLPVTADNYRQHLAGLNNALLLACLSYARKLDAAPKLPAAAEVFLRA